MSKNKMSVFTLGRWPAYYLRHPLKLIHEIYWNFRNFIHRGRFGFAYCDVWCMDEYLLDLIPLMLRYLAEHSCGYPGIEPFETPEKYKDFLTQLAIKFEDCQEDNIEQKNKYSKAFEEMCERKDTPFKDNTPEEEELRQNYFEETIRLTKEKDNAIINAYKELAENHQILWD